MYTTKNYQTKKALKEDVAAGKVVTYYQPGGFFCNCPADGIVYLEGPHYPEPHRWYAKAQAANGRIVRVF